MVGIFQTAAMVVSHTSAQIEAADVATPCPRQCPDWRSPARWGRWWAAGQAPSWCCRSYPRSPRRRSPDRGTARRRWAPASPRCSGWRRRPCRGSRPCRSCPCCPQRGAAAPRCPWPDAPWSRRWPASPWGFRRMVWPTMLARLGAAPRQQAHFIHGVQELAVGGLEAVDLRNGAGDDDAHGVGHIVLVQRLG